MKKLNREDIARLMKEKMKEKGYRTTIKEQIREIEVLSQVIFEVLDEGNVEVALYDFVKATSEALPEHEGINPKTREKTLIPEGRKKLSIKFTEAFKREINS